MHPRWNRLTSTLLGAALLTAVAFAQVTIDTKVDSQSVGLGGQVTLTLSLAGDIQDAEEPEIPNMEAFLVHKLGVSRQLSYINGQSSSSTTYSYLLTARKVGRFTIPPLSMTVNGQTRETNPVVIEVIADPSISAHRSNTSPANPGFLDPSRPGGYRNPRFSRSRNPFAPALPPLAPGQSPWGGPPGTAPGSPDRQPEAPRAEPKGPMVSVEADISKPFPYLNEAITYKFRFLHRVNLDGNPNYEPASATGFVREDLGQRTYQDKRDGTEYSISEATTLFFPTSTGQFQIKPTRLTCRLGLEDLAAFDNFSSLVDATRELVTHTINIGVKPLPTNGRPSDFSGGVGSFSLKTSLASNEVEQGQPVKLTITIEGDGHPDFVSQPVLPDTGDFKYYRSESHSEINKQDGFKGTKTFTVPVVPLKAGNVSFPALQLSYFDPRTERYETVTSQPLSLKVSKSRQPLVSPDSGSEKVVKEESADNGLRPLKSGALSSNPASVPGFLWLVQLGPWLGLLLLNWSRKLKQGWQNRSQISHSSKLGQRTVRQLSSSEIGLAALPPLLYGYLEERLGCDVNLSTCSLSDLERKLVQLGVSSDAAIEWRSLFGKLEELKYSPTSSNLELAEPKAQAQQLVQALEKSHQGSRR
jgi:hypothetical protein